MDYISGMENTTTTPATMKLSQELLAAYEAQVSTATWAELMDAIKYLPTWHPLGTMVAQELTNRAHNR